MFLDDEGSANEDARGDCEDKTNDFVRRWALACAAHASSAGMEFMGGCDQVGGRVHSEGWGRNHEIGCSQVLAHRRLDLEVLERVGG